jgi:CheY-like chemotaxis protein
MSSPSNLTPATTPGPEPRRVLVVEDHDDGRESLLLLLDLCGFKAAGARDGHEGVQLALKFQPHVALVDINLPFLDGFEVARRVRAALGEKVLLIALTAQDDPEVFQQAREASFDLHVTKPADPQRLVRLLAGEPPGPGSGVALRPQ